MPATQKKWDLQVVMRQYNSMVNHFIRHHFNDPDYIFDSWTWLFFCFTDQQNELTLIIAKTL